MQKYGKYEIRIMNDKRGWAIVASNIIASRPLPSFYNQLNAEEALKILKSDRRRVRHGWERVF